MDLPTTVQTSNVTWKPREEKVIRNSLSIFMWIAGILVTAGLVTHFVPTVDDAVNILTDLATDMTHLLIAGGVLFGLAILLMDVFGKNGKLHGLIDQYYSSLVTRMTYELLNVDPISPLTDKRNEMVARVEQFERAFASFDGTITHLAQQRDTFQQQADAAEANAKQAKLKLDQAAARGEDTTRWQTAFESLAYEVDSGHRTALEFESDIKRLIPVREQIKGLQSATEVIIKRLDTDIKSLKARWEAQKSMTKMEDAARGILKGTSKEALAQEAANIIELRYAESIGRLNNLAEKAQPLLDSIDLSTGRISGELLDKWQAEASHEAQTVAVTSQFTDVNPGAKFAQLLK